MVVMNLEKEDIIALDSRVKAFLGWIAAAGTPIFDTIASADVGGLRFTAPTLRLKVCATKILGVKSFQNT
jgi:hypothetical protein